MSAAFSDLLINSLAEQVSAKILAELRKDLKRETEQTRWPEMMTVKVASQYMGRSPVAIRHLIRQREIPAIKGDRKIQLRKTAIDEWAIRNEV